MTINSAPRKEAATITQRGISGRIDIRYDCWGVPHVKAGSEADLFFANGYAHAADRLWQMDAARRRALGRFAEWVGTDGLPSDILMRRLGMEAVSRANYDLLSAETRHICERYADGVNAFIAQEKLPPEYALLATTPEPWEGWHCVVVMRQRGMLMGSLWFKLWRAAAHSRIGAEHLHLLRYDDGGEERFVVPQDRTGRRWSVALAELAPAIEGLSQLFAKDATGGGSNSWAVDGRHTRTALPILAGDPHRTFEMPGMYSQIHLTSDGFDVLGFSVPGVPGLPHFGHNDSVAWGVTHAFADIHDLYVEDFSGQPPGCYRTEAGPSPAAHRKERITVRGASAVEIDIWETRHGPLILGGPEAGCGIALKSMQLRSDDRSLDCLRLMLGAGSVTEFYDVMAPWGLIDHNLVAADRAGVVGALVRARVPDRDRLNGWLPVPGWTGGHEWRGIIPFARMPREEGPASGLVVTANNRPVPEDWPDYICTDCHPTTRANRIHQLLRENGPFEAGDMPNILQDHHSVPALEIARSLLTVEPRGEAERDLLAPLACWNGEMDATQVAPSVYYEIRQEMTRILARVSGLAGVADMEVARLPPGISPLQHLWWALPDQLRRNDTSLLAGGTWQDVMQEAIGTVAARFVPRRWGEIHRPRLSHPLVGMFPEAASRLTPRSAYVGGDGDCVLATGAAPQTGATSTYGPVAKYVWDLADWDRSRWVVFHGASGNPDSPHYDDQNQNWACGELIPAFYSPACVEANSVRILTLVPGA